MKQIRSRKTEFLSVTFAGLWCFFSTTYNLSRSWCNSCRYSINPHVASKRRNHFQIYLPQKMLKMPDGRVASQPKYASNIAIIKFAFLNFIIGVVRVTCNRRIVGWILIVAVFIACTLFGGVRGEIWLLKGSLEVEIEGRIWGWKLEWFVGDSRSYETHVNESSRQIRGLRN
jgi:hypothetical protein